jgi:hypothetical protein
VQGRRQAREHSLRHPRPCPRSTTAPLLAERGFEIAPLQQGRVGEDLGGTAIAGERAVVHDQHALAEIEDEIEIVGRHDFREFEFRQQVD